ncbi:hypothetical protein SAMN05216410_1437 [Sanguibacter gelidistatuariae]|uniref:LemA protein n=1 Tax=Sanguibacter gelidistatuariae TaxID=1814289 RepID=A0A1G6JWS8_9MICO|nr:hypothetical protein [Sanguibacter gelidistatuariae]SDC23212.1 hypothetical protein SAMN05216410_1437 [Sanguibacter gelidistatuariae]
MTWSEILVVVGCVLVVVGWLVWVSATRLDRLHRKVVASRLALDAQLVRRSAAAAELATSGVLDPVSSVLLVEAAREASSGADSGERELAAAVPDLADLILSTRLDAQTKRAPSRTSVSHALDSGLGDQRAQAESVLSATLRTVLDDAAETEELYASPDSAPLLDAVAAAWYRVQLARRFHNEAVAQAQRVRAKVLVRTVRLAGHAAMPQTVEFDDAWPAGLRRPGTSSGHSGVSPASAA